MTNSWTWAGVDASTALTGTNAALSVYTTKKNQAGTYEVKLSNNLRIQNNGPNAGSTATEYFTPSTDSDKVVFTITVTDPCATATINALSFTPSTVSVTDGSTATATFTAPTNSVMDGLGVTDLLCGATSFALYSDTSDTALTSAWAVLTGPASNGEYTITIDTTVDLTLIDNEASVTHNIQVKSHLDDYTSRTVYTQLTVTITEIGCDCSALAWDNPSHLTPTVAVGTPSTQTVPLPTANTGATATNNAF